MCQIHDLQIVGRQWDANGNPAAIEVGVRASGCQLLEFRVFRAPGEATPLYLTGDRPVSAGGLANAEFAVTPDRSIQCGEVLWVEVGCQTDPGCVVRASVRVECKGFEGAGACPSAGPPLSVQPGIALQADCVAAGSYTVTIAGSWPAGTSFNWSLGDFPPGVTVPTGEHGQSFVLSHPLGAPGRILIAEVAVPGCPDVQSVVLFPPADAADCPTTLTLAVLGSAGTVPAPADGSTYSGLAPGDYRVRVTAPSGAGLDFEWYRDNALQPLTPATPNELLVAGLAAGTETVVAVRVQRECCNPLLDSVVLRVAAATGPAPGEPEPAPPGGAEPPVATPPSLPCLILGLLVALGLVVALVSLVGLAVPPAGVLALPALALAAIVIIIAGILLLLVCQPSLCRLLGIALWALKWAIALGFLIAAVSLSLGAVLLVLVYGMLAAGLVWLLALNGCPQPGMWSLP